MFSGLVVCGFIDLIGLIVAGGLVGVVKFWVGLLVYVNFFWFDFALWFVAVLDLFILLILGWGVDGLNCGFLFYDFVCFVFCWFVVDSVCNVGLGVLIKTVGLVWGDLVIIWVFVVL